MDERRTEVLLSQLRHANSLLGARLKVLEMQADHRIAALEQRIRSLEEQMADHEMRLRTVSEGVTQFKLFSGLASGGSGIMSLVAVIKAFLGG